MRIMDSCERKVDSRNFSGVFREMLAACTRSTQANDRIAAIRAFDAALGDGFALLLEPIRVRRGCAAQERVPALLSGFGDGTDLRLQGLVVLAFDLQLGLKFFDEEIEMGDLHAELLDVGWRGWGTLRWRRLLGKRRARWIC